MAAIELCFVNLIELLYVMKKPINSAYLNAVIGLLLKEMHLSLYHGAFHVSGAVCTKIHLYILRWFVCLLVLKISWAKNCSWGSFLFSGGGWVFFSAPCHHCPLSLPCLMCHDWFLLILHSLILGWKNVFYCVVCVYCVELTQLFHR